MTFKVHDGSFGQGNGSFSRDVFSLPKRTGWGFDTVSAKRLLSVEIASDASVKRFSAAVGWGAVGGLMLGPAGLVGGLIFGGRKHEVTFVVTFDDGRAFIATSDQKTWIAIQGAAVRISADRSSSGQRSAHSHRVIDVTPNRLNGESLDAVIEGVFTQAGWQIENLPKDGHRRFDLIKCTKGSRAVLIAYTGDALTDYLLDQMEAVFQLQGKVEKCFVVARSVGQSVERTASRRGIGLAAPTDIQHLVPR